MDMFNDIVEMLEKDQQKQNEILKQLELLKQPYKNVLYYRYIKGLDLEEISTIIGYSYYRTCKINGEALEQFDKLDK